MSIGDEIGKLGELHQRGALSDEEFARAKARVIGDAGSARPEPAVAAINAFHRSRNDRWLGGVCGGLAQVCGLAAWIWRLYLLLWIFVPDDRRFDGVRGQSHAG